MKKRLVKRYWRKSKFLMLAIFLVLAVAGGAYKFYPKYKAYLAEKDRRNDAYKVQEVIKPTVKAPGQSEKPVEIKTSALIEVPYSVQAPFANWGIHDESCEEAAALMYHYFLEGQTTFGGSTVIPKQTANDEFLKMKDWQVKSYGKEPDLSIEAMGKFMKEYYGHNYKTFKNITAEDIKREVSAGHPVVVPVMTHSLNNPYYGRENSYHVLLIKGYKAEGVITNDAGVKEGENYFYTWDTLFKAIDAQTPKMGQGREMVTLTK